MSIYVRELLFDMVNGSIDPITKLDIEMAIVHLYKTGQVDRRDILALDRYLSGETVTELSVDYPNCQEMLVKTLALIEAQSGYTDAIFLQRGLNIYPKYAKVKDALYKRAEELSREL